MATFFRAKLRAFALWILRWCETPEGDPAQLALVHAFGECGLNIEQVQNEQFDVARTGKLNDVLDHASSYLERPHPLRTVKDVLTFLRT